MLLQVFLQSGQQPGLQSTGCQSSLLLQRWLQCDELRLPPAATRLPAAVSASVVPLLFQVDILLSVTTPEHPPATRMPTTVTLILSKNATLPNFTLHAAVITTMPFCCDLPYIFEHRPRYQGVIVHRRVWGAWCGWVDYTHCAGLKPLSSTKVDVSFNGFH